MLEKPVEDLPPWCPTKSRLSPSLWENMNPCAGASALGLSQSTVCTHVLIQTPLFPIVLPLLKIRLFCFTALVVGPKTSCKGLSPSNSLTQRRKENLAVSYLSCFKTLSGGRSAVGDVPLRCANLPDLLRSKLQCKELI